MRYQQSVKDNKADIGFGFDGDGDRVGVIDNNGNEIFSDKIGLLNSKKPFSKIIKIKNLL